MSAPIPDLPTPAAQDAAAFDPSLAPGPPVVSLCGFKIPSVKFKFGFNLPGFGLPSPFPPIPTLALGLNCALDNPISVTTGVPRGGGRKSKMPEDPDKEFLDSAK